MASATLLDTCGRRRSPATLSSFHQGRTPRNKGLRYPADPPTVEEIVGVMRAAGEGAERDSVACLIVVLWRAGLRISEALALNESDLDSNRRAILVRRGKGGKRREVGMDRWAWRQLDPWLQLRATLPVGALFCVLRGPTRGHGARARRVDAHSRSPVVQAPTPASTALTAGFVFPARLVAQASLREPVQTRRPPPSPSEHPSSRGPASEPPRSASQHRRGPPDARARLCSAAPKAFGTRDTIRRTTPPSDQTCAPGSTPHSQARGSDPGAQGTYRCVDRHAETGSA